MRWIMMGIKCRLKIIMAELGIKQKWLAEKAEISHAQLSALANNKNLPTLPVAFRIAKALGMRIEDIWYEEETKKEPTQSE
jgi:putative transcriptional regulator